MKKLLLLLLLVIACNCSVPPRQFTPLPDPIIDDERAMTVKVKCEGRTWFGSGYVVDTETILTAGHVLACDSKPRLFLLFPGSIPVEVTESNTLVIPELDIGAIQYLNDKPEKMLSGVLPEVGERVCFYPAYPERGQKCGEVLISLPGDGGIYVTNNIVPGNSGSVVFNSKDEVVGVVVTYNPILGGGGVTGLTF